MGVPAVIRAAASFDGVGIAATGCGLWLFMRSAKNAMQPWLPTPLPPCDLWASAVNQHFHMVAADGGWRKRGGDVSFDSQPLVEKIGDRSLYADGIRIEYGRIKV